MKQVIIQSEKVKQLQMWLEKNEKIELAILFGSYAKGTQTSQSDLDLAIQLVLGENINAKIKLDYIQNIGELLGAAIDLVDLKTVGQPLLSQVLKYGKLLKGGQTQYAELAIKNINTVQDFLPYIDRIMSDRRMRCLSNG